MKFEKIKIGMKVIDIRDPDVVGMIVETVEGTDAWGIRIEWNTSPCIESLYCREMVRFLKEKTE